MVSQGYWLSLPVLHSSTLLFICLTYTSLHLLTPRLQSLLPQTLYLGHHESVSMWVCFCFVDCLCLILDSTYKWCHTVFVWLTWLCKIISSCMHVAANDSVSFFLRAEYLPLSEKAMAPHSSTLAWKIPWMEEPGGLQSIGSLRVGHDWATSLSFFTFMHWRRKWQPTPVFLPG